LKTIPELNGLYETVNASPLKIVVTLNSQIAVTDFIALDGLLARCVLQERLGTPILDPAKGPYYIPIPLARLWTHPDDGLPLWAASFFTPSAIAVDDTTYFHKRALRGERTKGPGKSDKFGIGTRTGRWAERRTPIVTSIIPRMEACCIGDAVEIMRLLSGVTHLGKKRSAGYGAVAKWEIEEVKEVDCVQKNGKLIRPIPARFEKVSIDELPQLIGWTTPYWYPPSFDLGWRIGTSLN
jgi:CRISPR type IV-associated protein Csf3